MDLIRLSLDTSLTSCVCEVSENNALGLSYVMQSKSHTNGC